MTNVSINGSHGKLVVISGPAGAGKGTVLKELFNMAEYKYSVSAATRNPRSGETDGIDYYFMGKEEFFNKMSNGDMLEHVEYPESSGNYYGTLKEPVERMLRKKYNVILEIEVVGALSIKEKYPEAVMIFLTPPTFSELERRLRNRGTETEENIIKRLDRAKKEVGCIAKYDYLVVNGVDMQKKAAVDINCIVESEKYKERLRNDASYAPDMLREKETMLRIAGENKMTREKAERFLKDYFT